VEPRYEDSALLRYVAHSHDCARSRRNTAQATDRRYEAARSGEAEGTRWLQARWNGQRTKLWAGECTATPELRTGTPAEESSPTSVPDATGGATPKDQQ
jgi:hypothetical protein